jgi:hypothetical protein
MEESTMVQWWISLLPALLNDNFAQAVSSIDFAILEACPTWLNIRRVHLYIVYTYDVGCMGKSYWIYY